jgi:hypothetical protein
MAVETLFAQIIHEAPSTSLRDTLPPRLLYLRLFRDEAGASLDRERWVTQRTYRQTHGVNPADCLFTHTYRPDCFTQVMDEYRIRAV